MIMKSLGEELYFCRERPANSNIGWCGSIKVCRNRTLRPFAPSSSCDFGFPTFPALCGGPRHILILDMPMLHFFLPGFVMVFYIPCYDSYLGYLPTEIGPLGPSGSVLRTTGLVQHYCNIGVQSARTSCVTVCVVAATCWKPGTISIK